MEEIQDLIRRIRQTYVDQFVPAVEGLAADSPRRHASEAKFSNVDSYYRNLITIDFIANDGEPNPRFINSDTYLNFESEIRARFGRMDTTIQPFKWDEAEFSFDTTLLDKDKFDQWFDGWFDPDSVRETDNVIGNIIHSVLFEDKKMTIDFGTAEVDAFWHLIHVLETCGIHSISIATGNIAPRRN
jgi:hypothetical protein